jgi:hypothetical protein
MKKKETKNMAPRVPESAIEFYRAHFKSPNSGAEWVLKAFPGMYASALSEVKGKINIHEDDIRLLQIDAGSDPIDMVLLRWKHDPPLEKLRELTDFQRSVVAVTIQ